MKYVIMNSKLCTPEMERHFQSKIESNETIFISCIIHFKYIYRITDVINPPLQVYLFFLHFLYILTYVLLQEKDETWKEQVFKDERFGICVIVYSIYLPAYILYLIYICMLCTMIFYIQNMYIIPCDDARLVTSNKNKKTLGLPCIVYLFISSSHLQYISMYPISTETYIYHDHSALYTLFKYTGSHRQGI